MFKRILSTGGCALLCLIVAAGCGGGKKQEGVRPRIALVMKSLANEFFKTTEDGARAHCEKHSDEYELICSGIKDEQDVNRQI